MHYLGTISVATTETKNNKTTTTDFEIPAYLSAIRIQSDTSGVFAELGHADDFETDNTRGIKLIADTPLDIPVGRSSVVLSIHNPTGGTAKVSVWALR